MSGNGREADIADLTRSPTRGELSVLLRRYIERLRHCMCAALDIELNMDTTAAAMAAPVAPVRPRLGWGELP